MRSVPLTFSLHPLSFPRPCLAAYERDPECPCCSPGVRLEMGVEATLQDVLDALLAKFPEQLSAPSVSLFGGANLYMRGVLEEETKCNLPRRMTELTSGGEGGEGSAAEVTETTEASIIVNDKKLRGPLRVKLVLKSKH